MENSKTAAILISRQNLRPSLSDEWVRSLIQAVIYVKANNYKLLSSVGTPNWEIVTACASVYRTKLKLIVPLIKDKSENQMLAELVREFGLAPGSIEIDWIQTNESKKLHEKSFKRRDEIIARESNVLIPISIRPNGHLAQLIQKDCDSDKKVINDFAINYDSKRKKLNYTINPKDLSNNIKRLGRDYVIHWTRATNAHWPDERRIDYYKDLFNSNEFPRTALATLIRIIKTGKILASSRHMPNKTGTVSWSGLAPVDTIGLMRWRSRFRQMSFEPYGIGTRKESALVFGIRPVQYYNAKKESMSKCELSWLKQSVGRMSDWSKEDEFRHKGDFDISKVPPDNLIVITYNHSEAVELKKQFGLKTAWFYD